MPSSAARFTRLLTLSLEMSLHNQSREETHSGREWVSRLVVELEQWVENRSMDSAAKMQELNLTLGAWQNGQTHCDLHLTV